MEGLQMLNVQDKLINSIGFAMEENSELLEMFNYHLIEIIETGVFQRLKRRWPSPLDKARNNVVDANNGFMRLGFKNLIFLFFIFGLGFGGAFLAFICETMSNKRKNISNTSESPE